MSPASSGVSARKSAGTFAGSRNIVTGAIPGAIAELVAAGPERLPDAYCLCSAGWVLEVFEAVAGRPVRVEVVQTIKRGAPDCRFLVRL